MKHYVILIVTFVSIFSIIFAEKTEIQRSNKLLKQKKMFNDLITGRIRIRDPSLRLPKTKIFWQGWIKYFHYEKGEKIDKPNSFFINNEFYNQVVRHKQRADKDRLGFINIPTKFHYYAKLMKDGLHILSSRKNNMMRTVDVLPIDLITPIPENARKKGGVSDLGNFDEGKCIQVETLVPAYYNRYFYSGYDKGMSENWVVCTDALNPKVSLLNMFIRLRILKQKSLGIFESLKSTKKKSRGKKTISSLKPSKEKGIERYYGPGHNIHKDGYWMLINDWSQCTLKCGGGKSYQQWACVPPKPGGKKCMGNSIRIKPCNEQPCPGFSTSLSPALKKSKNNSVVAPIYRALPFSSRPQQYIRCQIKEGDVLYKDLSRPGLNADEPVKVPSRLVMNNSTLSLYADETYTSSIFTFKLDLVDLKMNRNDICCFFIRSNNQKFEVCAFESKCGTIKNPVFFKEWRREFSLFAYACARTRKRGHGKDPLPTKRGNFNPDDDIKSGMVEMNNQQQTLVAHAQVAMMQEREKLLKSKLAATEKKQVESKIGKTQKTVIKALRKEVKLEDLIKKEETEKFENETKNLIAKFKHEKKKKKCLEKILKSREKEDAKVREEMEIKHEIQRLKQEALKVVKKKRKTLKKKILEIKKKMQRKNRLIEQQIQRVRGSMANELIQANKQGSWKVCKESRVNKKKMVDYCNVNFVDDYAKNMDCRDPENFCYVCCENEYGNMYLKMRDTCYNMCDNLAQKDLSGGDWVWKSDLLRKKKKI
jgi:hypothetical protein